MATSDTSEKGLESLIVADMTAGDWLPGDPRDYDRDYCVDMVQLRAFVEATQPKLAAHVIGLLCVKCLRDSDNSP